MGGKQRFLAFQQWFQIENRPIIKGAMAIFVEKAHSLGPQTMGVRLLGGCVYYAEYGTWGGPGTPQYYCTRVIL